MKQIKINDELNKIGRMCISEEKNHLNKKSHFRRNGFLK
jgi:hypothetical protein